MRAAQSLQACLTLCDPCSPPGSMSMGFSRQEYWSELPCPPPGDLTDPGIESVSPESPALQADSLPLSHQGSPVLNGYTPIQSKKFLKAGQKRKPK